MRILSSTKHKKLTSVLLTKRVSNRRCLTGGGAGYSNVRDQMIPTLKKTDKSMYRLCKSPLTCSLIGAPMTYGQPFVGTCDGPIHLREAGLRNMLSELGWRVEDLPDLDMKGDSQRVVDSEGVNAKNSELVGQGTKKLADVVEEKMLKGHFPLILGGDHSIALGSLTGILRARPDTGIIWVDAHADLNTPAISESGNMHGMPIGMLMEGVSREGDPVPTGFEWMNNGKIVRLQPESIVYVGLRDVDRAERRLIQSLGITAYTMHDIDRYGIGQVMEKALQHLLAKNEDRPLHLSYDVDAIDPILAPATGTAVRGGLTFREAHYVAEAAAASGNLVSGEIVELNPNLSDQQGSKATIELGLQIITSLMGKSII